MMCGNPNEDVFRTFTWAICLQRAARPVGNSLGLMPLLTVPVVTRTTALGSWFVP